jgi:DNA-directed RNA polymerase subunit RPC12/RpoP
MRTRLPEKNNVEVKVPVKGNGGLRKRLPIKKIYCAKCQKLVRGKAQISGNSTQINCPRCGQKLWSWGQISWKGGKHEDGFSH